MKRILSILIVLVLALGLTASAAVAATLKLTKIGTASTEGQTFRTWYYQGTNPLLQGTTTPDAQVSITLNNANNKVTADSNGDWTFQPTTLIVGQHEVTIGSDGQQLAFTLTISDGSSSSATTSSSSSSSTSSSSSSAESSSSSAAGVGGVATTSGTLPVTGAVNQTMLLVLAGFSIIGLGMVAKALRHVEVAE